MPPPPSARLYLVRHAKAVGRERWEGPDEERPLTPRGERQAGAICAAIAERETTGLAHLLSSPAVRCRETLLPLAKLADLALEEADWLLEGSDPAAALGHLGRVLGTHVPPATTAPVRSRPVAAACTHGDIMWGVLDYLGRRGIDLGPRVDAPKGAVWRLDYEGPDVACAELLLPGGEP